MPLAVDFLETTYVNSSWVETVHLVLRDGVVKLAVGFKGGPTVIYEGTSRADYDAMCAAPSKGKYIHAQLYDRGYRQITKKTQMELREPGMERMR